MQPSANMKPRAELHQSAPSAMHPRHVESGDDFAARPELDVLPQVRADERVMNEHQPVPQRHSDMVDELERPRARSAFRSVDHDKIRIETRLEHGLANAEELPGMADAKLEPDGLAARELA